MANCLWSFIAYASEGAKNAGGDRVQPSLPGGRYLVWPSPLGRAVEVGVGDGQAPLPIASFWAGRPNSSTTITPSVTTYSISAASRSTNHWAWPDMAAIDRTTPDSAVMKGG